MRVQCTLLLTALALATGHRVEAGTDGGTGHLVEAGTDGGTPSAQAKAPAGFWCTNFTGEPSGLSGCERTLKECQGLRVYNATITVGGNWTECRSQSRAAELRFWKRLEGYWSIRYADSLSSCQTERRYILAMPEDFSNVGQCSADGQAAGAAVPAPTGWWCSAWEGGDNPYGFCRQTALQCEALLTTYNARKHWREEGAVWLRCAHQERVGMFTTHQKLTDRTVEVRVPTLRSCAFVRTTYVTNIDYDQVGECRASD